ncbi:MAG: hypothetical protein JWN86_2685 [Planctomycetota bacterium]|nr:hypothetical protein [Planctomycetota bacterium]
MPRRKLAKPQVESLESMTLMSATAGTLPIGSALVHIAAKEARPVAVHAMLHGTYTRHVFLADAGTTFDLSGAGRVSPLGRATVRATLHNLGFIATGHAGGTLTLSTAQGSVTLNLTGPLQDGFSPLPTAYDYTTVGGTGRLAHVTSTGTATLTLVSSHPTTSNAPVPPEGLLIDQGQFTLVLSGRKR